MAYILQGDYDRALADCNQLLALEPRNAQAYANRSIVYHGQGEVQQALLDYTRAMQIDPRSIMSGWNQGLAETARLQTTRRLADYIDGLRHESLADEEAPAAKFQIVVQPAVEVTENHGIQNHDSVVEAPSAAEETTDATSPDTSTSEGGAASDATTEEIIDEILADPPPPPRPPNGPEEVVTDNTEGNGAAEVPARRRPVQRGGSLGRGWTDAAVRCPNCRRTTVPSETFFGGRLRCGSCQKVYFPSKVAPAPAPTAAPAPPPSKRPVRDQDASEEKTSPNRLQITGRPAAAGIAAAVLLCGLSLWFTGNLYGRGRHLHVYPAAGQAFFEERPIPGASIVLNPVGPQEPICPRPQGVVKDDGSFVLGTYDKEDGAPRENTAS